jgi:hypothetical protein
MGRDVKVFDFDGHTPPEEAVRPGFQPRSMGSAEAVREAISRALVDVDWSNPRCGVLTDEGYTLEFDLGQVEAVQGLTLHIHGGGDVMGVVAHLCLVNGWAALDHAIGEFLDLEAIAREGEEAPRSGRGEPSLN